MKNVYTLIVILFISTTFSSRLLHCDSPSVIPGHYIVMYNDHVSVENAQIHLESLNLSIKHRYMNISNGFSSDLTKAQVAMLLKDDKIDFIECDQTVTTSSCSSPKSTECWGLTRIAEETLMLDSLYSYPDNVQRNVVGYVIDTGIYVEHDDFGGRAEFGWKAESGWSDTDSNGHGTHVASTMGGIAYGVAPSIQALIAVKVLGDNGSGSNSGVIAGINWVKEQYSTGKYRGTASVANLSLGGGKSTATNNAVNNLMYAGVVTVVAAGNDNDDAALYSPASAADVITVGSTSTASRKGIQEDIRSSFSNYGYKVDILAPGSLIKAAWIGSKTKTNTISGTSMASPHVAGVAALKLMTSDTLMTASAVKEQLLNDATKDVIDMDCAKSACTATPNKLLFNGCSTSQ